ncbi:MAG: hypothetical protein ACREGI_05480 [Candidatus Levyibacteriota bacterium]
MKKLLTIISCVFLFALFGFLFVLQSGAQETSRNITIVPPSTETTVNPGDKTEGTLKFINDGPNALTVQVSIQDFVVENNKGTPVLLDPNTLNKKFSAASWIAVYPNYFTVPAHQQQILNYYIQIPSNARPGGHYAAVVYTPISNVAVKNSGASVQTVIGSLFAISVSGAIVEQASITKFFANAFQEYGPVSIQTQIKNFGDLHIKPLGDITVYNMFGKQVAILRLPQYRIFPEVGRDYENIFGGKFMIGRYRATLLASYGVNNNLPLTASIYFWVFPWKIAVVLVLIIIAVILGFLVWMNKQKETELPDEKHHHHVPTDEPPKE